MAGRDYQMQQVDKAVEEVSNLRKVLVQLPTGGGKTYEFSLLAKRFIVNTDKAVLILVHREELMYQAAKTIKKIVGIDPYLITSKTKRFKVSRVYIGMVESTVRRLSVFHNVGLVIIDECHQANFNKIHNIFLEELIIGYTATPISSSKKEPLNKYYNAIVAGPQIPELIKLGFLAQNWTRCPKEIVDNAKFKVDKMKGEFDEGQMAMEYSQPKFVTNVVSNYHRFCYGKKTIIFNVNIEHSKEVDKCFKLCGYNSRHLDSNSPDRAEILKWFKETPDAILNNVMIATVGFDEPTIQNVILNFSTMSLVKFVQCAGRGGRIIDEEFIRDFQNQYPYQLELKNKFNIIDMGGNAAERFGDWNDERDWEYIFNNPEQPKKGGVAPVKICPECSGMVHASVRVCVCDKPNGEICGYEFEKRKEAEEKDAGEMVLITKGIDLPYLIQKTTKKYDYYLFLKLAEPIIKNVFETFTNPSESVLQKAFIEYYRLCIQWYRETMAGKDGNIADITESAWHIRRARNNFDMLVEQYKDQNILRLQQEEVIYN